MIDKATIRQRFKRSINTYDNNATVQKMIITHLCGLLEKCTRQQQIGCILEIGCGTGLLTRKVQDIFPDIELEINDLVGEMCYQTATSLHLPDSACIVGDIETVTIGQIYDLIVSASTFQWLNTPEQTVQKLAGQIRRGGFLVFSTFGNENLYELKTLTGQGLAYPAPEQWEHWLVSAGFELLHAEDRQHILYFQDPMEILLHVKQTGVNATSVPYRWTKSKIEQFRTDYKLFMNERGSYPLTYHPVYVVCRKK